MMLIAVLSWMRAMLLCSEDEMGLAEVRECGLEEHNA
jgi:hypothetical protein